jgi:hypothetical protein
MVTASVETAAPVISLDLDIADPVAYTGATAGKGCSGSAAYCRARSGATAYGGGTHGFTENFSKTCPAGPNTNVETCPVPTARAYDHHDGELSVVKKLYLVNNNGVKGSTSQEYDNIDYKLRSEWLMTFDAEDGAGNKAQQIVFAMILDDTTKPTITPKTASPATLEACDKDNFGQQVDDRQFWLVPNNNPAMDNYDGDLTDQLKINVKAPNAAEGTDYTQSAATPPKIQVNTHVLGEWTLTYSAHDHAGMFGENGEDNAASMVGKVVVRDSLPPTLYCAKQKCVMETGGVRSSVNGNGFISSAVAADESACCDLCEKQQWSRVVGSNAATNPAMCSYFHFSATGGQCHLFSSSALTEPLTVAAGVSGGYPQQCQNENTHECAATYTVAGAKCIDIHDSLESDGVISATALTATAKTTGPDAAVVNSETVDKSKVGAYTVSYTCSDLSGNAATAVARTVNVVDSTKPVLSITTGVRHQEDASRLGQASYDANGNIDDLFVIQHSSGYTADVQHLQRLTTKESGFTCTDTCDGSLTDDVTVGIHTGSCDGDQISLNLSDDLLMQPKNYYIKYTCADKTGNAVSKCRTIEVADKTKPVITVVGQDLMTSEASATEVYADKGAICSDQVDGLIPEKIQVTGAVVDLAVPDSYTVTYNCKDSANNEAIPINRIVKVEDTKCPTCTILGATEITREASFPYADGGATCTDTLDGALTATVHNGVDVETTGVYTVSYTVQDKAGNANCADYVRTVTVKDTLKPVIALRYEGKLVHTSSVQGNVGANGQVNPAGTFGAEGVGNPHLEAGLMAQMGASSSWMVAAVASGVVGLALIAFGSTRQTQELEAAV